MTNVISIVLLIVMLGILIFVHEFGHFFLARRNGITVTEFSIGMGPKIVSWVRKGTRFSLRWIPFGGYCSMLGNASDFAAETPDGEEEIAKDDEHSYTNKNVWQRISVTLAGPFFNFLLALLLAFLLVALVGTTDTTLAGVSEGYPAQEAGLQKGDVITKLDHTSVHLFKDIQVYMSMHEGEAITVQYKRDGVKHETTLTPYFSQEENRYLIGIFASNRKENLNLPEVLKFGWYEFTYNTGAVIKSLGMLVTGKASFNDLSGPVGIAGVVSDIVSDVQEDTKGEGFWTTAYWVFINLLSFTILISANLAIMNLIPIPGLDGGRLIFLIYEAIFRKPIPKKYEGIVTLVGFALLLLLTLAVFFNDIRKVFFG